MVIRYNAPASLSFSLLCVAIFLGSLFLPGLRHLFYVPGAAGFSFSQPLDWFRLVSHVAGHGSWDHLLGNLSFILLLGPILEEKYGSGRLCWMMLATALATGLVNVLIFSTGLLGASGIVFMFILLVSFTNFRSGEIPLSFLLVVAVFLSRELVQGLRPDHVAQFAHLIGGACGSLFGFTHGSKRA